MNKMKLFNIKYMSKALPLILLLFFISSNNVFCQKKFSVNYIISGKDTSNITVPAGLKKEFDTQQEVTEYLSKLPALLLSKGFPAASVDSINIDSTFVNVAIYVGRAYRWVAIKTDSVDPEVLNKIGWDTDKMDFSSLQSFKNKLVNYYENNGYPFVEISIDQIQFSGNDITGRLQVNKGILYHIDSIKVFGKVKIRNSFLQHYLEIYNGSIYNNKKLNRVSKLLKELSFLEESSPWSITMLGAGAVLNLYLEPKRSSQIDVLIGFLPSNSVTEKSRLTADVHLDLNNALGAGENILVNWQQLQPQSPRLNLGYTHPYIFNSNFGINFSFDLLKRDSAFLQLSTILGLQYLITPNQWLKVFYQNENSYLLSGGVDTNQIINTKQLPPNIDVITRSFGLGYHWANTDYHFNPRKGNEFDITATAGIKKISKNKVVIGLKDPFNPSFDFNSLYDSFKLRTYRFKITAVAAHYFSLGKNNVLKAATSLGLLQSPSIFQNELFRIGGYRLLRGFDEESIYANQYAVFTAEYRYLVGLNSYFFGFSDIGLTKTKFNNNHYSNSFISGGIGIEFETNFGLLNLSFAVGKRNDVKFNIRNSSRIHFGYINYF